MVFKMANKVEICGVNTAKLPLYKEEEMMEMLEKIKAGDKETRDEFIKGNLRLVLSVIQRFSNRGENPDDLFQVGCIGLIKALDNFDMSHGVKFSTYAVPTLCYWGKNKRRSPNDQKTGNFNGYIHIRERSGGEWRT